MPRTLAGLWLWVQARFRLSESAVCELSRGLGTHDDYHDYPDSVEGVPDHFIELTCRRCGKKFCI